MDLPRHRADDLGRSDRRPARRAEPGERAQAARPPDDDRRQPAYLRQTAPHDRRRGPLRRQPDRGREGPAARHRRREGHRGRRAERGGLRGLRSQGDRLRVRPVQRAGQARRPASGHGPRRDPGRRPRRGLPAVPELPGATAVRCRSMRAGTAAPTSTCSARPAGSRQRQRRSPAGTAAPATGPSRRPSSRWRPRGPNSRRDTRQPPATSLARRRGGRDRACPGRADRDVVRGHRPGDRHRGIGLACRRGRPARPPPLCGC